MDFDPKHIKADHINSTIILSSKLLEVGTKKQESFLQSIIFPGNPEIYIMGKQNSLILLHLNKTNIYIEMSHLLWAVRLRKKGQLLNFTICLLSILLYMFIYFSCWL